MADRSDRLRVAVIGSGIAGLCAAHLLSAYESLDVDVYEAAAVPGGRANVIDGAEHCQRLFIDDYKVLLPILNEIDLGGGRGSVRSNLVRMRRWARTPSLGWVEITHQYSLFAREVHLAEKIRIIRAGRQSALLARQLQDSKTNILGGPKNKFSTRTKLAIARNLLRTQGTFSLPQRTDRALIEPWVHRLTERGVSFSFGAPVEAIEQDADGLCLRVNGRTRRHDAVICTAFISDLRVLLDRSSIRHRLPEDSHAHCACFTVEFDPEERSERAMIAALYSCDGLGIVVQPALHRCVVLCIKSRRNDEHWVIERLKDALSLTHAPASIRVRSNAEANEALFVGDHVRAERIVTDEVIDRLYFAGSWTRNSYPVDSGESAARSASEAVSNLISSFGLAASAQDGGG